MSITHIKTKKKIEVFLRLLEKKESLQDACSKAGLDIKSYLLKNRHLLLKNK